MKLVRYGEKGREKPGAIDAHGRIRDLSGIVADFTPEVMTIELRDRLTALDLDGLPVVDGNPRLGAPIARTGHFIAIGLNYVDHAKEAGQPIPAEPVIFSKAPSSLSGPNDDVILPRGSVKGDWEVELGFVIGRHCHYVDQADALSAVFGYVLANDVSERAFQIEGTGQWIKGKSAPTFGPIGPWLVTADEISDPQDLAMWLDVNGERMQTGNTKTMIFPVSELIAYCSEKMDLEPGDLVITGTPPGVGLGMKPQKFLKAGDEMRLGMDRLGEQRQKVVAFQG
ncbi:fumarylacetoacetate hydrolase family protein [Faunimonas sp. B44]|uniref:fumarylacetoacetate hydrolase family protein n=1 Tax=Faunimonas sp. B44 TaxID=3461493 RepID=UPI0040440F75